MSLGLLAGLLTSIAWGVVDITAALSGHRVGSLRALAATQAISVAVLLGFVVLDPARLGPDPMAGISAGMPIGILAGAAYLGYFTALKLGPLAVVSPIIIAYGGLTVILAVMLRGETLLPLQAAGAVLATAGVILTGVVFSRRSLRSARLVGPGVLIAFVTIGLFALVTVLMSGPIREHGWLPVAVGSRIANASFVLTLLAVGSRGSTFLRPLMLPGNPWNRTAVLLVLVTGLFDVAGYILFAIGLEIAPVWLIGLASSFGPVLAIGYAVWRLGERLRPMQWAGLAMLGVGVLVLAVSG
jgi:drug/metabolite transporter (DMT)-like permease